MKTPICPNAHYTREQPLLSILCLLNTNVDISLRRAASLFSRHLRKTDKTSNALYRNEVKQRYHNHISLGDSNYMRLGCDIVAGRVSIATAVEEIRCLVSKSVTDDLFFTFAQLRALDRLNECLIVLDATLVFHQKVHGTNPAADCSRKPLPLPSGPELMRLLHIHRCNLSAAEELGDQPLHFVRSLCLPIKTPEVLLVEYSGRLHRLVEDLLRYAAQLMIAHLAPSKTPSRSCDLELHAYSAFVFLLEQELPMMRRNRDLSLRWAEEFEEAVKRGIGFGYGLATVRTLLKNQTCQSAIPRILTRSLSFGAHSLPSDTGPAVTQLTAETKASMAKISNILRRMAKHSLPAARFAANYDLVRQALLDNNLARIDITTIEALLHDSGYGIDSATGFSEQLLTEPPANAALAAILRSQRRAVLNSVDSVSPPVIDEAAQATDSNDQNEDFDGTVLLEPDTTTWNEVATSLKRST